MKFRWTLFALVFLLSACSSRLDSLIETYEQELKTAQKSMKSLENALDKGSLTNAVLLQDYAEQLGKQKPELAKLAKNLAYNSIVNGPLYQSLKDRIIAVDAAPKDNELQMENNLEEIILVKEAANIRTFNDALTDPINVIADLSDGKLPRINSIDKATEKSINKSEAAAGSQLVGNPQYGQWVTGSNGLSFWEWYGIYALFSDLDGGRRYKYSSWSYKRPYSYYHDYGRYRYTRPKYRYSQKQLQTRTAKSFRAQGKKFTSPYSKQRVGASKLSKASTSRPSSGSFRNASTFRNSSSSSSRRSSSRTSRGPRRGK
ncbi:hypothetical protein [Pleionea sp. CnH1-48]|uniref:hypothetical protein n=1 Tax=Pleionea sp. CnH1-48 TaxID=2954494 RepID=UPI0020973AA7|nr:hypothetical protein [Pleionea sp. CnH1-48]MCO7226900.1 hypothetical protein [Pleionea sp. CnH1-48]